MSPFIETVRIEKGRICNLPYHNERMNKTRKEVFRLSDPLDLSAYIHPEGYRERTKCRVEYDAGILGVEYVPYRIRPVASLRVVVEDALDYFYKSTDRNRLNELFSLRGEADDILIVRNGLLTDTSICNIALWDGRYWLTPDVPLLAGTQRALLLETGEIVPAVIRSGDLSRFSRIRLFNAMIGFGEIELSVDDIT